MDWAVSLEARRIELPIEPPFQLGPARVDPPAHEITWAGKSRRVQPQTLKVLVALHDKLGQVVTRDELVDRCWDGRFVGQDVINRSISVLRRLTGEIGGVEIQTVPRGGYRLVEVPEAAETKRSRKRWVIGGGAAAVAGVLTLAAFSERLRSTDTPAVVAVEALKAAPDDRAAQALSQGLRSSIEADLAGSGADVTIVDGNSTTTQALEVRGTTISDHGQLRASVELVSGRTGEIIWASNFERPLDQLDDLRDQLSLQVARELHCAYSEGRGPYFNADIEFARLSLAHCDSLGKNNGDSLRLDAQIVQREPGFARGWSEYAIDTAFSAEDLPPLSHVSGERRAIALAHHALALDPHQGLAYTGIGVATEDTASWPDTERLARHALAADPKSPEAHNWHSGLYAGIGRLQEGLNEAKVSYDLDHFLPGKIDQLIRINIVSGNLDDAQDELVLARRNWPLVPWWNSDTVLLGIEGVAPDRALQLLTTRQVRKDAVTAGVLIAFLHWRIAPTVANRRAAVQAIENASRHSDPTGKEVELLAMIGDLDAAFQLGARLPSSAGPEFGWFDSQLGSFRADPRFMPLAARTGLAKTWLQTGLWPDFCREPGKLRSCQDAAAKAVAELKISQAPSQKSRGAA